MPSKSFHTINFESTRPASIISSIRYPISFLTKAVTTAVLKPKHFARPLATLYSPPPSDALNPLEVLILPSPGSKRSITSPKDNSSYIHLSFDFN